MSEAPSPLGFGLYFIDVLACLLFCITLALVGARFGYEQTVAVDLPGLRDAQRSGADVSAPTIAVRAAGAGLELFLEGEPLSLAELEARLRAAPPPAVVVRAEESALTAVIAAAHAAGVRDIQLAYEIVREGGDNR